MSNNYEPELMYALDSKGEYSDWKNVYNVSGDDVCYCPICLGRVKLWNGQDPDRTYKKQRCFHHIDGMCSQESRIHFAYKTWLLEPNSKFKVGENIYEVKTANIEKTLNTTYGNYRPDIVIETIDGKIFYVEVADTNKKTDDYVLKWDELGNDVIEIDVNEQLVFATIKDIPVFNLIYSSKTGKCFIKHYVRKDYDELISERKIYWKRKDLLTYKIKWEKLDWFWRDLQNYYVGNKTLNEVCKSFSNITPEDQRFICTRFKNGKHKDIRYELEKHYSEEYDRDKARLNNISLMIRKLNKEFGYSTTSSYPYLCTKNNFYGRNIVFMTTSFLWWESCYMLEVDSNTTDRDIYDYFYPIMKNDYEDRKLELLERKEKEINFKNEVVKIKEKFNPIFEQLQDNINNSGCKQWKMEYELNCYFPSNSKVYSISITLLNYWNKFISFEITENFEKEHYPTVEYIKDKITDAMKDAYKSALIGNGRIRLMEAR